VNYLARFEDPRLRRMRMQTTIRNVLVFGPPFISNKNHMLG
jgi:hypothetical protein